MGFFDRLAKHDALFRGMSDRLGVDFNGWIGCDAQHAGDYRNAVLSCTSCKDAGACVAWQEANAKASAAPDFCRNKRMLDVLATK